VSGHTPFSESFPPTVLPAPAAEDVLLNGDDYQPHPLAPSGSAPQAAAPAAKGKGYEF